MGEINKKYHKIVQNGIVATADAGPLGAIVGPFDGAALYDKDKYETYDAIKLAKRVLKYTCHAPNWGDLKDIMFIWNNE